MGDISEVERTLEVSFIILMRKIILVVTIVLTSLLFLENVGFLLLKLWCLSALEITVRKLKQKVPVMNNAIC